MINRCKHNPCCGDQMRCTRFYLGRGTNLQSQPIHRKMAIIEADRAGFQLRPSRSGQSLIVRRKRIPGSWMEFPDSAVLPLENDCVSQADLRKAIGARP